MGAWTGTWETTFGEVKIIQNEARVYGLYRDLGVIEGEIIEGTNLLRGTFTNGDRGGRIEFRINARTTGFEGTWGWDGRPPDRRWIGRKTSRTVETDCRPGDPWRGAWKSRYGDLHLHQNGHQVYGLYGDRGVIKGAVRPQTGVLDGQFTNGDRAGRLSFTLGADGEAFDGTWSWDGSSSHRPMGRGAHVRAPPEDGYVLEGIDVPYAPGRTDLVVKVRKQGSAPGRPRVEVAFAPSRRALEENPVVVSLEGRDLSGPRRDGSVLATLELPAGIPGRARQGELLTNNDVFLRVRVFTGNQTGPARTHSFRLPQPIVAVNVGDSFGAGHGVGRYDLDEGAKRSSNGGQHRALVDLSDRHPTLIINEAASGSKLVGGIISGDRPGGQLKDVERTLADWKRGGLIAEERVDYLVVSAGGNDAHENGLGGVVTRLLISIMNPMTSRFFTGLRNEIADGVSRVGRALRDLDAYLDRKPQWKHAKVIYTTYPDPTKDEKGRYAKAPSALLPMINRVMTTLSAKDFEFIYEHMIRPLNEKIRGLWGVDPDRYVRNDVEPVSRKHGYPSRDSWFVRWRPAETSVLPDETDAFHPNDRGAREIYTDTIRPCLNPVVVRATFTESRGQLVSHRFVRVEDMR